MSTSAATTTIENSPTVYSHADTPSHEHPDLTLETAWYINCVNPRNKEKKTVKHTLKLLVNKEALSTLPASDKRKHTAIEVMLSPRWTTSQQAVFTLGDKNDHGVAWQFMLSIFTPTASTALTPEVFASSRFTLDTFWHLAVVCDKWNVDAKDERVTAAFVDWYKVHAIEDSENGPSKLSFAKSLLWPSWYFNHAEAFRWATDNLIYNDVGHINPFNPTKYSNIIIPKRIVRK
jgi:hypothetical protein